MRDIKKPFGKRVQVSHLREPKRKYFLVFEGAKTEVAYFKGIIKYARNIGISNLIEIRPLLRSYSQKDWSNPKKILISLLEYISDSKKGKLPVSVFIDRIIDFLLEEGVLKDTIYSPEDVERLLYKCFKNQCTIHDITEAANLADAFLRKNINLVEAVPDLIEYIKNQDIDIEQGFDKICLIVDRDSESFKDWQFDFVLSECREKGFDFYMSNPCFEFWLLLHFEAALRLSREKMLHNMKINKSRSYLEKELSNILGGYKKNKLKFNRFKNRIDIAIRNEKYFCEDIESLKTELGSNVGLLIKEMKKDE